MSINSAAVREMLVTRGIRPEDLPPAEDVKKVQRKLEGEDKKILRTVNKSGKPKRQFVLHALLKHEHL